MFKNAGKEFDSPGFGYRKKKRVLWITLLSRIDDGWQSGKKRENLK